MRRYKTTSETAHLSAKQAHLDAPKTDRERAKLQ